MKMLSVKRNIIVLIIAVMLLINGVQGISYGIDSAPTVTPGEINTTIGVSFIDFLFAYDENAYQIQLRRKSPQGDWITKCSTISLLTGRDNIYSLSHGNYVISASFTDLEPGTTYEARYRDTNLSECHDNPPAPQSWSAIAEGTTRLVTPPRVEFADAALATAVRKALDLDTQGEHIELLKIPEAELAKLTGLQYKWSSETSSQLRVSDLTGLEHATQLITLGLANNNIRDLTPLAQLTQLTTLDLWRNNIRDLTPLTQLTELRNLDLSSNGVIDLTPLTQLTELRNLDLSSSGVIDLTPLTQLTELRNLDLSSNGVIDLTPLTQLTELIRLDLSYASITDVTPLAQLLNLQSLRLVGNNISDYTPLIHLSDRTKIFAVAWEGFIRPSDIELITVSSSQQLTEATLNGSSVTLTLVPSGAAYDTSIDNIRNAMTLTGIDGVTVSDVIRVSDTELKVTFGYTGNLDNTATLTISLEAEAVSGYQGRALTGAIPVFTELGLTATPSYPLSAVTLNKNVVTLTLSSGAFESSTYSISEALTVSGITGIIVYRSDIVHVSATVVTIELTFKGDIETDTILTFTLEADAIKNYNGPSLTAEIPVAAVSEVAVTGEIIASTEFPLTKATLDGSYVKLTLQNYKYEESYSKFDNLIIVISGIPGVSGSSSASFTSSNNKEIWVKLSFEGNLDNDATLTLTVPPSIIENYYGPLLAATLPVTVKTGQQVLVPESQRPSVFWINTETDKIESLEPFRAVTQQVTSLNVDTVGSKVYWSERGSDGGTIKRANLDGKNVETLVTQPITPQSITVDTVRKKLYWVDAEGKIQSVDLNGENIKTIIQLDGTIGHIAVDAEGAKLYWADWAGRAGSTLPSLRIRRVNLDGTSIETPLAIRWKPNRRHRIDGIAIADGKIYWTERQNLSIVGGIIYRANLNGINLETLATSHGEPTGIAVDTVGGKVYWANLHGGIQRMDINGGEIENVAYGIAAPGGLALGPALTAEVPVSASTDTQTTSSTPEVPNTDSTVSISPSSVASPAIGKQLELSLNITGGEAVAGYQATVQFDTTALGYVSSTNGDYLPDVAFFVPPVDGNSVTLNAASLAGESSGGGTLATLTFEVVSVKASTLTLSEVLLVNSAGESFRPQVEEGQITESLQLTGDVNGDGMVNIQDLVLVAGRLGQSGANSADVNGDGSVNIQDLVLVAGALGNTSAAPSLHPHSLEILTAADVKLWLTHAQQLDLTDATSLRGIRFLEQLLAALLPKETTLLPNYPNPFNPETWIPYRLAQDAFVTLTIYDGRGQIVRTLDVGYQSAAFYETRSKAIYWNGRNEFSEQVASGVYFYHLSAGDYSATRKMLILK